MSTPAARHGGVTLCFLVPLAAFPASCDGDALARNVLWYRLSPPSGLEDSFEHLCRVEETGGTKGEKYAYENICLLVGVSSNATDT